MFKYENFKLNKICPIKLYALFSDGLSSEPMSKLQMYQLQLVFGSLCLGPD